MIIWVRRHKGAIIFALTIVVVVLAFSNAWKHHIISAEWLAKQKDSLSALSSVITMCILVAGSIFSYYRFFRGRTLSLRLELSISTSIHQTASSYLLHAVTVTAKNVGGTTIWNPKPNINVRIHGPGVLVKDHEISGWWDEPVGTNSQQLAPVIDPGETVTFFAHKEVPTEAWAVTYSASITADSGDCWFACKTVSNKDSA